MSREGSEPLKPKLSPAAVELHEPKPERDLSEDSKLIGTDVSGSGKFTRVSSNRSNPAGKDISWPAPLQKQISGASSTRSERSHSNLSNDTAPPAAKSHKSTKSLQEAVRQRKRQSISRHVREGAPIDALDSHGRTALHYAEELGDADIAVQLMDAGASVNMKFDADGNTPLHFAVYFGQVEIARQLVCRGATVNEKNQIGSTPLHEAAAMSGASDVVGMLRLLLDTKADLNAINDAGYTPTRLAEDMGLATTCDFLQNLGGERLCSV